MKKVQKCQYYHNSFNKFLQLFHEKGSKMLILLKEHCSSFNKFLQYFAQIMGFLMKRRQYANEIIGICKFLEKSLSSRDLIFQNAKMGGGGGGWLGQH